MSDAGVCPPQPSSQEKSGSTSLNARRVCKELNMRIGAREPSRCPNREPVRSPPTPKRDLEAAKRRDAADNPYCSCEGNDAWDTHRHFQGARVSARQPSLGCIQPRGARAWPATLLRARQQAHRCARSREPSAPPAETLRRNGPLSLPCLRVRFHGAGTARRRPRKRLNASRRE